LTIRRANMDEVMPNFMKLEQNLRDSAFKEYSAFWAKDQIDSVKILDAYVRMKYTSKIINKLIMKLYIKYYTNWNSLSL
jgi:hypothetical protein